MVDVLGEQRNLYRAKRDLSRARYDYLVNFNQTQANDQRLDPD